MSYHVTSCRLQKPALKCNTEPLQIRHVCATRSFRGYLKLRLEIYHSHRILRPLPCNLHMHMFSFSPYSVQLTL
uniref:Uncharacterized protein n=1 Tax=Pararge aegeria TaxID=116150 RepID=S4NZD4_9NEOP